MFPRYQVGDRVQIESRDRGENNKIEVLTGKITALLFAQESGDWGEAGWSYHIRYEADERQILEDFVSEFEIMGLADNLPHAPRVQLLTNLATEYRKHLIIPRRERPNLDGEFQYVIIEPQEGYQTKSFLQYQSAEDAIAAGKLRLDEDLEVKGWDSLFPR